MFALTPGTSLAQGSGDLARVCFCVPVCVAVAIS